MGWSRVFVAYANDQYGQDAYREYAAQSDQLGLHTVYAFGLPLDIISKTPQEIADQKVGAGRTRGAGISLKTPMPPLSCREPRRRP
jgi:hypothetical protein